MKKTLVCLVAIFTVLLFGALTSAQATPLPWLDFSYEYIWDGDDTFTDNNTTSQTTTYVSSIKYKDGSSVPIDPLVPTDLIYTPVTFSISYNGVDDDWIQVGDGTIFKAELDVVGSPAAPGVNNIIKISWDNLVVGAGMGSRWANEFASTLSSSSANAGILTLGWQGSTLNLDGTTTVNGTGKISPVPEPGTFLLLGLGITGLFYVRRSNINI